jgi:hypothetical protein
MNYEIQSLLRRIAAEHLGIETLEERRRDSLDFHDVSVWGVHRALAAAFDAGHAVGAREQASIANCKPVHSPEVLAVLDLALLAAESARNYLLPLRVPSATACCHLASACDGIKSLRAELDQFNTQQPATKGE